ncbi:uncharacterized protein LOC106523842 [Austrofundulus limnaeus]|uniref:Uncharacterized protein LOC106523842 n=1 Tax=Austrofundulus limnaeus TaxID=52670 RepID=A0A2I4BYQ5_AUSLI|nr:PREDICTED: uncharacterized protein LOC106523842 [Austrofundulus limnaeus]
METELDAGLEMMRCWSVTPAHHRLSSASHHREGVYAVQVVMEDFPSQTITLTHSNGSQEVKTPSSAISKIPIQFGFNVVPAVPSCTLGLYVPAFLPPTPQHRTQINATVNQTVEIPIITEATESTLMSIQFSGPYNVKKITSGPGQYTLRWTPSDLEGGQSHPICFVVQANYTSVVLHSEFRCVVVTVPIVPPTLHFLYFLKMKISTTMSLENNKDVIEKLIKDELIKRGLPSHIGVHLRSNASVKQVSWCFSSLCSRSLCGDTDPFNMLLSVLLLLLMMLVSGTQAGFLGQIFSCIVRETQGGGNEDISQEKLSYSSCQESSFLSCHPASSCYFIEENIGEWCQSERINNLSNSLTLTNTTLSTSNWVDNINNITVGTEVFYCEQRNRSDIGKANTAPQTTIIPVVRVPSNCQKNINLLAFDSNGDEIKCRYASSFLSECDTCTPPSVLNLSSSCSLSFSPTITSAEGSYVVQMIMEDFPRQTIILTDAFGVPTTKTTSDFISKTPIQFLLKVVPAVPSCTNGVILPTFLPPTPDHQTQIFGTVNQTLQIPIRAEATRSVITGLLFSGPHTMVKSPAGPGNYNLTWTPSDTDYGWSQPICVIVQANFSGSVYHSDLRCLLVTVNIVHRHNCCTSNHCSCTNYNPTKFNFICTNYKDNPTQCNYSSHTYSHNNYSPPS